MTGIVGERTLWYCSNLPSSYEELLDGELEGRTRVQAWSDANLVSSRLNNGLHALAVDVDLPAKLSRDNVLTVQVSNEDFVMADEELMEGAGGLISNRVVDTVTYERGNAFCTVQLALTWPSYLIASKTTGHYHLYSTGEMDWPQYWDVLGCLGYFGLIQTGFLNASRMREMTVLRKAPLERHLGQLALPI